jgi:hypothetical protein
MITQTERIARANGITEALRAATSAIHGEQPTEQTQRIFQALKALQDDRAFVPGSDRVDYLERVQIAAQTEWNKIYGSVKRDKIVQGMSATAAIRTPLGTLSCTTWFRRKLDKKLQRDSYYELNGDPITVRAIKASGLVRRPTSRNRKPVKA